MIKKIYMGMDKFRAFVIIGILGFMVVLCLTQVVLRYFTSEFIKPFPWGDEVLRLSCVWVTLLSASVGVKEGSHFTMDLILKRLPAVIQKVAVKIVDIIVIICIGLLIYYGYVYTSQNAASMLQTLPELPIAVFYAAIPIGGAYMFIDYIFILIYGKHPYASAALGNPDAELNSYGLD